MSKVYDGYGYENDWTALGAMVWFDGPYGDRLYGEIIRTSSNPDYYHVWVDGRRYEVSLNQDRMSRNRDPD